MLNDEQIEKILYRYAKRQDEFSLSVIRIIADRLGHLADFDNLTSFKSLSIMQEDISNINMQYSTYKKDQKKRIRDDLSWILEFVYGEALIYYENQIALEQNRELMELLNKQTVKLQSEFEELVRNPVITMRDMSNSGQMKDYSLADAYRSIINEAFSLLGLSEGLSQAALKRTETQLFESGVRYMINDTPKRSVSANKAIRMNILDGIRNFIDRVQEIVGKQFGADGVELSAHIYPAPDHALAQGHQYTQENINKMQSAEDFEDYQGNHYDGFERQIGTLNCRHYFMMVKLGQNPTYTQEELDKILEDNERGYTAPNGRHYTLYECTQIQRRYERNIRKAKEKYLFSKTLGNKLDMFTSRNRVGSLTTQYKQFSQACGIPVNLERTRVKDY